MASQQLVAALPSRGQPAPSSALSIDGGSAHADRLHAAATCFLREYRDRRHNRGFRSRHSQFGEDFVLLPTLLAAAAASGGLFEGLFVELGALDGVSISNTFLLERCFNWTGVLIEANPTNFANLQRSHRRAHTVHAAVCPSGSVTMSTEPGPVSSQLDVSAWRSSAQSNVTVHCQTLTRIMHRELPPPHRANILSLDVEGAEAVVLSTVDPARFDIIMVETGMGADGQRGGVVSAKDAEVDRMITTAGLVRAPAALTVAASRVYLRPPTRALPFCDTSRWVKTSESERAGASVIVPHPKYKHYWLPAPSLNESHLASLLAEAAAQGGVGGGRGWPRHECP
jgi:FkbM family methyltransferase